MQFTNRQLAIIEAAVKNYRDQNGRIAQLCNPDDDTDRALLERLDEAQADCDAIINVVREKMFGGLEYLKTASAPDDCERHGIRVE